MFGFNCSLKTFQAFFSSSKCCSSPSLQLFLSCPAGYPNCCCYSHVKVEIPPAYISRKDIRLRRNDNKDWKWNNNSPRDCTNIFVLPLVLLSVIRVEKQTENNPYLQTARTEKGHSGWTRIRVKYWIITIFCTALQIGIINQNIWTFRLQVGQD